MVNKEFIENFDRMNFKTDDIKVLLMSEDNKVIDMQPLLNLKVDNTKAQWTLTADRTVFKSIIKTGYFYATIVNKTVDNITLVSTSLQHPPENTINDVEILWSTALGIIHLTKI